MNNSLLNFSVQIYGDLTERNETTSMARCRIFYKGLNRNGSYITDEFAEKLLQTLPYTPIKGIYLQEEGDYSTHGMVNSEGRIYGVVPENPNVSWETNLDEDGQQRVYACCDVLIYTALYKEAGEILDKPESMELYPPSIKGNWINIEGHKVFQFTDGCFFGLQVLGDEVEPCFEGAAFFTLNDKVEQAFEKLKVLEKTFENYELGGDVKMNKLTFKLSDSQKYEQLFNLLNPVSEESEEWVFKYAICEVYDDYALVYDLENNSYARVSYTKDEDNVVLGDFETTYILDVTESELAALKVVQAMNGESFEKIDETFSKIPELETKVSEFETKIEEKETEFATLSTEKNELEEQFNLSKTELETANQTLEAVNAELEGLKEYKLAIEKAQRQAIIDKYAEQLAPEIIDNYSAETEVSAEELEKSLAFELVKSNPSLFSKDDDDEGGIVPKETPLTGIEAIISKHKK